MSKISLSRHGKPKEELVECKYDIEREARQLKMVVRCKECQQGKASLKEKECISGIINVLAKEIKVDSVILSHHVERQYFSGSMELLIRMTQFANELENLSLRTPPLEIAVEEKKSVRKHACAELCKFHPKNVFIELRGELIKNIENFYNRLKGLVTEISALPNYHEECISCKTKTISDFNYIADMFENIGDFIRYEAYMILPPREAEKSKQEEGI